MCSNNFFVAIVMVVLSTVVGDSSQSLRHNSAANRANTGQTGQTGQPAVAATAAATPKTKTEIKIETTTNKFGFDENDPLVKIASHEDTPFLVKVQIPGDADPEVANADPNTVNMLVPKNQCNVCQKFFTNIVFPRLIDGTPACQPKHVKRFGTHGDGPAFKGFCQLWTQSIHGDKRGSLELMVTDLVTQDGHLGTDPSCTEALAFDACVDMAQCTETPCDVCQDKVTTAASLALNSDYKGLSPIMEHFETMCNDATNPEILKERKKILQAARDNAAFLKKYQPGYNLFATKKIQEDSSIKKPTIHVNQDETCASLSSVDYARRQLKQAEIKWGESKPTPPKVKEFCKTIGFCRNQDTVKIPNKCRLPEETKTADGGVHEGAQENWVKHDVAKKLTYKYTGKIRQKGHQSMKLGKKLDKVEEHKDSWVTADVLIRTAGNPVNGMARFEVRVKNAKVGTYDQHDKWRANDLDESDFPYFFSRDANGHVTHVHHDPAEKYFDLQIKHEIAKMFSTDLKGDEPFGQASTSFIERGKNGGGGSVKSKHQITVLLEKTSTHVVVRKTSSGISHHRVFAGQGKGLATLHHRGEATIMISTQTGDIEKTTRQDKVQTETDETLDENNLGPNEKCDRTKQPTCTASQGGPRGESVDGSNKESLVLMSRRVYTKNSHGAKTISNFLETSMHRLKTVSLWDESHIPTRAEHQEQIQQYLNHPQATLAATPAMSNYVEDVLKNKSGDRDHRTFQTLAEIVRHRPALVQQIYQRAASMVGKMEEIHEYSRIVNVLAAGGTVPAQRALLALLGDKEGKSEYQRHMTLNTLGFTRYGAHSEVVDALEHMAFNLFGNQTRQNIDLTDPVAAHAPITLGTVVHFRHHIGHVDPNERKKTMELQDRLEKYAQGALDDSHPKAHKLVWINALGNTGRNSSLSILSQYLNAHRAGEHEESEEHNDVVRAASVMALRQIPGNHSEFLITSHLFDPSPKVREAAANVYASSHRQAGEGTAEKLHQAWLHESEGAVLSLLEKAKTKAGSSLGQYKSSSTTTECKGCVKEEKFSASYDEVAIPYTKQWDVKTGSDANSIALEAGFNLQFIKPYANAKAGLVMHTLGNDVMLLGIGLQITDTCFKAKGKKEKTATRPAPYVVVFNQEIGIPLASPKPGAWSYTLGKCKSKQDKDRAKVEDDEAKPRNAKERAAYEVMKHKRAQRYAKEDAEEDKKAGKKSKAFKTSKRMGGKQFKKNKKVLQGSSGGAGSEILTPRCGPISMMEIYSQEFTAPPAPAGLFMTPIGPLILTIQIEVIFTIGLEGQVSACGGGEYEKLAQRVGIACAAKKMIDDEKDCFGDAIQDTNTGVAPFFAKAIDDPNAPKGCSYRGGKPNPASKIQDKATMYYNYHKTGSNKDPKKLYAPVCKVDAADNTRDPYNFMGALAPFFSVGLRITASAGYPFIFAVNLKVQIEFFKLQLASTLTASTGEDKKKDIPAMVSAADFYTHLLAGMVGLSVTFLPLFPFEFEVDLIKVKFPGPNGKYHCLETALPLIKLPPCPTTYFINAPGTLDDPLTLSTFPVNLWCTDSPGEKNMCPWRSGRKSEEDMEADQSLNLARGKCKQTLHCAMKDFDGYLMDEDDSIATNGALVTWKAGATFRDKNNYRSDSNHQNKQYNHGYGTELVAGVERPIQSYVIFDAAKAAETAKTAKPPSDHFVLNPGGQQSGTCSRATMVDSPAQCKRALVELGKDALVASYQMGHMVRVGNSANTGAGEEQCMPDESVMRTVGSANYRELSSQCCSMDGTTGTRMDPSCYSTINFAQAEQRCVAAGKRLCTDAEVAAGIGAGSGCNHDLRHVWTSTECTLPITGTKNFYESGTGPGPLGCAFNEKTNDLLWTYPMPHSPDKCLENGNFDSDCCALEKEASCETGFTLSFTDMVHLKGKKTTCGTGSKKYKYTCREATVSATRNTQYNKHGSTAVRPVCKRERTCGRVVLRGKQGTADGNKAYVFNFGGEASGKSSIARATLSGEKHDPAACREGGKLDPDCCALKTAMKCKTGFDLRLKDQNGDLNRCWTYKTGVKDTKGECAGGDTCAFRYTCVPTLAQASITNLAVKASNLIYDLNNCNTETPFSFWVRVDTYGHAAMGKGGKVGENTLLQWKDPNPIKWVHSAGFGSTSGSVPMQISKVEVNRGYKHEVYCWPPNLEEDPDKKGFKDEGTCYRKMPDSYLNTAPYNEVRTNPLGAPQLSCHKPNVIGIGEPLFESCISGVCRQLKPASKTWRCAGCSNDKDCAKRRYVGKNCNIPGLSVVVRRSDGYYYGGRVMEFDGPNRKGWGAPNNGKINVKMGRVSGEHAVDRSEVYYCKISYTYKSTQLPNGCSTSCVVGSIQCPLEQPASPGLEPDACWDGSRKAGNRGVCMFEEHQKSYSPLVLTDAALAVDRWGPRKYFCSEPGYPGAWCAKNSHCANYPNSACVLGRCSYPIKDYHQCNTDSQCENKRCTQWWSLTKKCRPVDGWKDYEPCVADNHCKNSKCYKISTFGTDRKCRPNAGWGYNKMCKYNSNRGNVDCSSGDQLVCFKISGRCKSKLNDYVQCDDNLECKSGRCNLWWGATKKCTPTNGWRDYEPCTDSGHCTSSKCYKMSTYGEDKKCRPNNGWATGKECKHNSGRHDCLSNAYCHTIAGKCKWKLSDMSQCDTTAQCLSNSCTTWWGLTKKCKPTSGWPDRTPCIEDSHCASRSCVKTGITDRKCKPSGGWHKGEQCTSSSHCGGVGNHIAGSCRERGGHDSDCCALPHEASCANGAKLSWQGGACWVSGGKRYLRYTCQSPLLCMWGKCQEKLNDYAVCASNGACKSNSCAWWYGGVHKCKPSTGWADRSPCQHDSHCASRSCVKTGITDRKCKPSGGWHKGEQCTSSSHCSAAGNHDAGYCRERGGHDSDCCALAHEASCANGAKLSWQGGACWVSGSKRYLRYKCQLPLSCMWGKCQEKLNDYAVCASNGACKSNSCAWWYGGVHKCKPSAGWADRSPCQHDSHCASRSCVVTRLTDKKCKPSGGWNKNEQCSSSSHCAGTRKCDGFTCQDIKLYNRVRHCDNCYGSCSVMGIRCNNCYVCGGRHDCRCRTAGCPFVFGRVLSTYDSRRCWDWDK